ncbi:uncharacterized protein LOC122850497 [Aphidius gifuensis]|uniref:uncharacterized protein LOC122850497 n=1 Tax=Aphidius gifuensis TaxID=684658 RepID=UPI001CDC18DB|nr:uncharacterized protein LOC122850497 [Aphidius gifuensis]
MPPSRKRGPYKLYLLKKSNIKIPRRTKYDMTRALKLMNDDSSSTSDESDKNMNDMRQLQIHFVPGVTSPDDSSEENDRFSLLQDQNLNDGDDVDDDDDDNITTLDTTNYDELNTPSDQSDHTNLHSYVDESDSSDNDFISPVSTPDPLEEYNYSDQEDQQLNDDTCIAGTNNDTSNFLYPVAVLLRILLLLALKIRYSLTYAAAEAVAKLVDLKAKEHVGSISQYNSQKIVDSYAIPIQVHHFCPSCHLYACVESSGINDIHQDKSLTCCKCNFVFDIKKNRDAGNFFVHLSLAEQLKEYFGRYHTDILYSNSRKKYNRFAMENIFDSELYKKQIPDSTTSNN